MSDSIDRQVAIDALKICDNNEDGINCYKCPLRDERWNGAWEDDETNCYTKLMRDSAELLSVQPDKDLIHLQKEQAYMQGYEDGQKSRKGEWIWDGDIFDLEKEYICSECRCYALEKDGKQIRSSFCANCGAYMRESKKPKSCFECEYSSEIDEDTVLCTEIKTMMSTSQNRNNIPPFCPKYLD